jgi:hypothetical protein
VTGETPVGPFIVATRAAVLLSLAADPSMSSKRVCSSRNPLMIYLLCSPFEEDSRGEMAKYQTTLVCHKKAGTGSLHAPVALRPKFTNSRHSASLTNEYSNSGPYSIAKSDNSG